MRKSAELRLWCAANNTAITLEQIALSEIPAPTGQEEARGKAVFDRFAAIGLDEVHIDDVGNVLGLLPGHDSSRILVLAAHLDTVFPAGTDVRVRRAADDRLIGPGINDNAAALGTLLAVAEGFQKLRLIPQVDVLFFAPVGEEGLGNLRGTRHLFDLYSRRNSICGFLTLDADIPGSLSAVAVGSRRYAIIIQGPGGHSYSDFGTPSALHAACRAVVLMVGDHATEVQGGTINIGIFGSSDGSRPAGTSINTICAEARFEVDLRSTEEATLDDLNERLQWALSQALAAERLWAVSDTKEIEVTVESLGYRPGGAMSSDHPLFQTALSACHQLGLSVSYDPASTDANIPLSLGIPALVLWRGGTGGGTHTLQEWHDPSGRQMLVEVIAEILLREIWADAVLAT